ncbi:Rrf2 family transcriptional regulator [Rhodopirellula sp.]|nr:Rrf2 family transcriptional regulator [Rhodopirellula sp.]MDB4679000.1 Rrf2 family transcriptional regulator [Rhodopirellula sp.]
MLISARVHYACLAMLELAARQSEDSPVALREISDRHGVPGPFLVQIFRSLRSAGWVQSVRGNQGGYRLLVDPDQIRLLDIAEVMGCQEASHRKTGKLSPAEVMLQQLWDEATDASRAVLANVRLSELAQRCRGGEESMFYI